MKQKIIETCMSDFPNDGLCPATELTLSPEIESLMAVHLLYWKTEKQMEIINIDPPLTKNERHLIVRLEHPSRMGSLAKDMLVLPSTLTAVADSLEAEGLLVRHADPSDRRASLLSLTPKGVEIRLMLIEKAATFFADVTGLSPKEIEEFALLSRKIKARILQDGVPEDFTS
jgi:DNA-binding MarR family transcriptional regulator